MAWRILSLRLQLGLQWMLLLVILRIIFLIFIELKGKKNLNLQNLLYVNVSMSGSWIYFCISGTLKKSVVDSQPKTNNKLSEPQLTQFPQLYKTTLQIDLNRLCIQQAQRSSVRVILLCPFYILIIEKYHIERNKERNSVLVKVTHHSRATHNIILSSTYYFLLHFYKFTLYFSNLLWNCYSLCRTKYFPKTGKPYLQSYSLVTQINSIL